jgi:hypothetical protein
MFDDKKLDKDTRIKYLTNTYWAGFGLWWAMLLMSAFLPEAYITEDGRMFIFLAAMTYAVVIVGATFWSGYSKKAREISNATPGERMSQIEQVRWSWIGGFVFMFILRLIFHDDTWYEAALFSLFVASFTAAFTYFVTLRKPKNGQTSS